jgi:hypothetical protein
VEGAPREDATLTGVEREQYRRETHEKMRDLASRCRLSRVRMGGALVGPGEPPLR